MANKANEKILNLKNLTKCLWYAAIDMIKHDGIEHAGYIAFLLMVGIFPFLVFLVAIVGVLSETYLGDQIFSSLIKIVLNSQWSNLIDALKPRIIEITTTPPSSFLTIAILGAAWTASSIFEGLRTILNRAYRVNKTPTYILRRLLSIIEFMMAIFIIGMIIIIFTILPLIAESLDKYFSETRKAEMLYFLLVNISELQTITMMFLAFNLVSYLYYFLPNSKQKFTHTFPGTIITLLGWWSSSIAFKYYVVSFPQINMIYGSIAGIIVSLLYFYICSVVFIFGAEFNYHYLMQIKQQNLSEE